MILMAPFSDEPRRMRLCRAAVLGIRAGENPAQYHYMRQHDHKRAGVYLLSQVRHENKDKGFAADRFAPVPSILHLVQETNNN
jgi:hypothetical protein